SLNRMFGMPADAGDRPLGDFLQAIDPQQLCRVSNEMRKVVTPVGGDCYEQEYRLLADGQTRWVRARGFVRRDEDGIAVELVGMVLDITRQKELDLERKRVLESAEDRARIFDMALSAISDFAYVFDRDGRFLYVNKALLDLWGLSLDQVIGKNFFDLKYPDALASRLQRQIQQVIETGRSLGDETPYTSPTGAGGYYEYIFAPVVAADGTVELIAGSTRDISARKHTEDALRSRTAQFETLLNNAPLGVYLVDADFRLRELNPTAHRVFGGSPDLIGRDFAEVLQILWPKTYADEVVRLFRQTLETGQPYFMPERIEERRDIQKTEVYEWQINRIPLPDGRPGVVCYFRDLSQRVRARHALEAADRQKNEFLAMLAHELRNPLAPIHSSGELLARMLTENEHARAAVAIIRRQVSHLRRLVDDLLDVSRISQGRIDLRLECLPLETVIAQAIECVEPLAREKGHHLKITTSNPPLLLSADRDRLVQCIANVLMNAVKYTGPGGQIWVESRKEDEEAVISISDNGTGISEELRPHVFDLFVQGTRTLDRAQGGLGIGLAVAKRLVEMHRGRVSVASHGIGHGATFEIRLPRIVSVAECSAVHAPLGGPCRRVLIVDDNADAADTLAVLLNMEGHEAQTVHSGREALVRAESFQPDVVLLDIGLPEMDGYEVARRIRELLGGRAVRLVAVTGYGGPEDRLRTRAAGFDAHLLKPLELATLARVLLDSDLKASSS
ncbi:MAG TPA: PAS domain-containing protein, partial [Steroidobacteraceae bacterium]